MILTYSNIKRYTDMPSEQYFKLGGFSHSFLKREQSGIVPQFTVTPKMLVGSITDAILTEKPEKVDVRSPYFTVSRSAAIVIKETFGDMIPRFVPQVCYTAMVEYQGLYMNTTGRLDWELPKHAVLDLKMTDVTSVKQLIALVQFMGYDNQMWNYCKMAGVTKAYILAYSTKLKKCLPPFFIDCSGDYNEFWANGILKFGSVR